MALWERSLVPNHVWLWDQSSCSVLWASVLHYKPETTNALYVDFLARSRSSLLCVGMGVCYIVYITLMFVNEHHLHIRSSVIVFKSSLEIMLSHRNLLPCLETGGADEREGI